MRHARHQDAHCCETFLAHDLPLQRLQHLAHLAFLLDLSIQCEMRLPKIGGHRRERGLKVVDLTIGRRHLAGGERSPSAIRWTAAARSIIKPLLV